MYSKEYIPTLGNSIDTTNELYWKKIKHPFRGGIEITTGCNLKCRHCYVDDKSFYDYLSYDDIVKILDKMFDAGVLFIYFTGGEVFTRKDFKDIYIYAKKKGFMITILTNGTLINDEVIDIFNKYPPLLVSISIYGCSEKSYDLVTNSKGQFSKFKRTLELLDKNQISFELKFIIFKENYNEYDEAKNLAEYYDVPFSYTLEFFPTLGGNLEPIEKFMLDDNTILEFEEKKAKISYLWEVNSDKKNIYDSYGDFKPLFLCSIDCGNFFIDKDGNLYPCNKLRIKNQKSNIVHNDFKEVYKSFSEYKLMEASKNYPCLKCSYIGICNPCPAINLLANGDLEKPPKKLCKLNKLRMGKKYKN